MARSRGSGLQTFALIALVLAACGQTPQARPAVTATSSAPAATTEELVAVGEKVFPLNPATNYNVECTNFKEGGAKPSPAAPNDYSTCPVTQRFRARLEQSQELFAPGQNPPADRVVAGFPQPGGGVAQVKIWQGHVEVDLVVVRENGQWLVDDVEHKGGLGIQEPITFSDKPAPSPTPPPPPPTGGSEGRILNVPWYHQALELSCEEASLRMALAFQGIATTDQAILDLVGVDGTPAEVGTQGLIRWGDPYVKFVGNPAGSEVSLTGYGVYYPPIVRAAQSLGATVGQNGEGISPATVYAAVLAGHPVETWVTYKWVLRQRSDYTAFDGRRIPYAGPIEHAVLLVGVRGDSVLVNNPWDGPQWVSKSTFEAAFATYNQMAIVF